MVRFLHAKNTFSCILYIFTEANIYRILFFTVFTWISKFEWSNVFSKHAFLFKGIFLIVVVILYPLGWDNEQTQLICHNKNDRNDKAEKFQLGSCSVGISYFCAIGGMASAFFCAMFSFVADKAVFSSKVQDQILEGNRLICTF